MRHWDGRLARLFRALIACTVLLFAAQSGAAVVEPARDVSAWVVLSRVPAAAPASVLQRARAPRSLIPRLEPLAPPQEPELAQRRAAAARAAPDERYLYLDLQTLRC